MAEETADSNPHMAGVSWSWSEAMLWALARPSVRNYEMLANAWNASAWRAYLWVFLGASLFYIITTFTQGEGSAPTAQDIFSASGERNLVAVVSTLGFLVLVGATHLLARILGGPGRHTQLVFVVAAFYAPFELVDAAISAGELVAPPANTILVAALTMATSAYLAALSMIAVKAVHGLSWRRTALASSLILLLQGAMIGGMLFAVAVEMTGATIPGGELAPELEEIGESEAFAELVEALAERTNPDGSILSASINFDVLQGGGRTEIWSSVEVSTITACSTAGPDPCEELADQMARLLLENYADADELAGLRVVIGSREHDLRIEPADVRLEKSMSIAQWREELAME
jgi:hypothetical protein